MRQLLVIGIGPGHPDQITVQAVEALNRADVFFVVTKGEEKSGLVAARQEIMRRHIRDKQRYRVVEIADPPRARGADDYRAAVADWHGARAQLFTDALRAELDEDRVGAVLVWGDPSLYDGTLRMIDLMHARPDAPFEHHVIPGVASIHALAAAHRTALNRIGEPVLISPSRQLPSGLPEGFDSAVVMLDSGFAAAAWDEPDLEVFWAAYAGTDDEVIVSGRLADAAEQITTTRAQLRERHGWIMDSYLVRRPRP